MVEVLKRRSRGSLDGLDREWWLQGMILADQRKPASCTMNVRYRNAPLAKARESSSFRSQKQSAATLARAADNKLRPI